MALKTTGIVISLETKLLIVRDSVMGCFYQAPGDGDASPDALFIYWSLSLRVQVIGPSRNAAATPWAGRFTGPFLPATRLALPLAICKDKSIGGQRLQSSEDYQT